MDRDPTTGRFIRGNQVSIGNKGNTKPKWGNKNALVHGLWETISLDRIGEDGCFYITQKGMTIRINPEGFYQNNDGSIMIRNEIVEELRKKGFVISIG